MQWSADENAGFTSGKPWLKLNPNYPELNALADLADPDGVTAFFKSINSFKKSSDTLKEGSFRSIFEGKYVYAFERTLGEETLVAVCNFKAGNARLPEGISGRVLLSNYGGHTDGKTLRPYEYRLIRREKQ